MTTQEAEHRLKVLVEIELYNRIRVIRDAKFPNEKEMIEDIISSFEERLPEWTKDISNCHSIILETISRTDENIKKIERTGKDKHQEER